MLVLGVAYKNDVDDAASRPAFKLMELLARKHAEFTYHDPFVPVLQPSRRYDFRLRSVPLTADSLAAADAVLIATDHSTFDYDFIVEHGRLIVDTRNATRNVQTGREKIVLA